MVATTATQGLRYPQTTDAPCDGDLHTGWFADDVEAKLNAHDVDLARTLSPPSLIMVQSEAINYFNPIDGIKITFDVIEQQTGGSFGLFDANPTEFHFPQLGFYQVGALVKWPEDAGDGLPGSFNLDIVLYENLEAATSFSTPGLETDVRIGVEMRSFPRGDQATLSGLIAATDLDTYYSWIAIPGNAPINFEITYARMYAVWVGDL